MNIQDIQTISRNITDNISKVIVGKSENINYILTAIYAGGHILLEDVPGTGKTTLAKTLAAVSTVDFPVFSSPRICCPQTLQVLIFMTVGKIPLHFVPDRYLPTFF